MPNELSEKVYPDGTVVKLRDDAAREQIATKASIVDLGTISANSNADALNKAWDALTVYEKPVLVYYSYYGWHSALMFKYSDARYGTAIAMKYDNNKPYVLNVKNGTKYNSMILTDENVNYTVSDITDLNQSMTINEFSLRKCGQIATLGMNFNISASMPAFTQLFKLPSGITGFGRNDAAGVFTTKELQVCLSITASGFVLSNSSIAAGSYYSGQIVFICK